MSRHYHIWVEKAPAYGRSRRAHAGCFTLDREGSFFPGAIRIAQQGDHADAFLGIRDFQSAEICQRGPQINFLHRAFANANRLCHTRGTHHDRCSGIYIIRVNILHPNIAIAPRALKLTDAASDLSISRASLRRLIKRGLIKPNLALRHYLVPISELDRFLEGGQS